MKFWTGIALLAAWLLVGIGAPGGADTTKSHFKIKGDTAVASFQATDPQDPCIESFVSVVASDLMEKVSPGGGPTSTVRTVLLVGLRDPCLDISTMSAEGETPEHTFRIAHDLSSATLRATVPVFNLSDLQWYTFEVDLTWTAQGEATRHHDKETFRDKDLGLKITSHLRGKHAEAQATGTVVAVEVPLTPLPAVQLGQNVTPEPSDTAELQTENNGTIIIEKTQ
jgi:hypothetical protein